ncbi:MAG: M23 family metallopeptidase [Muribaculaceae bacterium]|nr:M23 family metallopeptidase [Muribaculaceae bacterium]
MKQVISLILMGATILAWGKEPRAKLRVPLDIPLTLSGNFGELRSNHFHSGIDFKTQGRTGLPVYCADDGYVSRIVVSPWGFGRAVYVTHPESGLVTVYGHLESFSKKIDTPVRERQYEKESFSIDTTFGSDELPVKRGEIIGKSGNAGSSGGPHLHMDVRDAATEYALDPLEYYDYALQDNVAPEVRSVVLYPREGLVNGASKPVTHTGENKNASFTAWGRVVPGIKAYDKMTGTTNIYGVKYLTFICDGDTLYKRVIDHIDFNRTRAVNTLVEYGDVIGANSWVMITEQPESRPLADVVTTTGDGTLEIYEERDYPCQWILEDHHGNRSRVKFTIKGVKGEIPVPEGDGTLYLFDSENVIAENDALVEMPANTLYSDAIIDVIASDAPAGGYVSRRFKVGDKRVPLAGNYKLTLPVDKDTIDNKSQYVIVRVDGKSPAAVSTSYINGMVKASVNRFGSYSVKTDSQAPKITPVTPAKWAANRKIVFKISDNLSGISSYRGEIDGNWVMFEFDGKTGTLSYVLEPSRVQSGKKHTVTLVVTDECGNEATYKSTF